MLCCWNCVYGFVGCNESVEVVECYYVECFFGVVEFLGCWSFFDIGLGGGFFGLILVVVLLFFEVCLVESCGKKVVFFCFIVE